ncbi:MAG TPA: M23 family metallopeptidase [Gemmatimonadaceae bacterium]|nr:M23 family metallopeptidase [Gemmatimonadaceae bacterium]
MKRLWRRFMTRARFAHPFVILFCALIGATTCLNLRAPTDAAMTKRMPPVVVTRPDETGLRLDMRPMLGSDSAYFLAHPLMVPVEGISPSQLTDTYHQGRSGGRIHMATDIMAMRGTPVLSAANGRVIKLANGGAGGITIFIADASGRYLHYYAHLMGYAPNVAEGVQVQEGDVIGFVGSTGNASPEAPHLHFQITRNDANYWNGTPIDVRGFITKPGRMRN